MLTSTICSNSSHLGFTICLTIKPVEGFSRHSRLAEDPWKDSLHTFSAPTTRRFQTGFSRPNRERSRAAFWASSNEASASKSPPITISYITSSISSNSTQPVCVCDCACACWWSAASSYSDLNSMHAKSLKLQRSFCLEWQVFTSQRKHIQNSNKNEFGRQA